MKDQNGQRFSFTKREIVTIVVIIFGIGVAWGSLSLITKGLAEDSHIAKVEIVEHSEQIIVIETKLETISATQEQIQKTQREDSKELNDKLDTINGAVYKILGKLEKDD